MSDREARLDALRDQASHGSASSGRGYYDRPLLKRPVWTWEIPAYFFAGGVAGVAAMVAAVATLAGADPLLVRDARWIAAAGAAVCPLLLISDLGRPARFLNMLRVFKYRSPMSIGAWTLTVFAPAVVTPVVVGALGWNGGGWLRGVVVLCDIVAVATGLVIATYTGVLIGATAIPVWAAHARLLPIHFGASSLGAAVSIIELCGHFTPALNRLGLTAAIVETIIGFRNEVRRGSPHAVLGRRTTSSVTFLGDWLSGPIPLILRVSAKSWPLGRPLAAVAAIAGSLLTRYGWLDAGRRSADSR
jgi:formate-dependent nitrite reductase membrane component NrfD